MATAQPQTNRFLAIDTNRNPEIMKNLFGELDITLYSLALPGEGEAWYVKAKLKDAQAVLAKFREFGWGEVSLMNENDFEDLAQAIGTLKRAGMSEEIKRVMVKILHACFGDLTIPQTKYLPAKN